MAKAYVAFYMGSYQQKTQHLDTLQHGAYFLLLQHCWTHGAIPLEPAARAAIARMPLKDWKKIAPTVDAFFDAEGKNSRATEEAEKAERISLKRAMIGQKGGFSSGLSKSVAKGKQLLHQERSKPVANGVANRQQNQSNDVAIQNRDISNTSFGTARESIETPASRGSLATALPAGALREPLPVGVGSHLLESLERLKQRNGRKVFVDHGTAEWAAHQHDRQSRGVPALQPLTAMVGGIERTGLWLESEFPPGYDEATGEKIAPASEDAA